MASNFPTSLDSFTDPTSGSSLASPSHSGQHIDLNDAVEKIETKLGIGSANASSAANGAVLTANGSGSTSWAKFGSVGYGNSVTAQTGFTTLTDITGLSVTFTASANRIYLAMAQVNPYGTAAESCNTFFYLGGTILSVARIYFTYNNVVETRNYFTIFTTTAGSKTVKISMSRNSGTNVVNNYADADFDCYLAVMDIGPT